MGIHRWRLHVYVIRMIRIPGKNDFEYLIVATVIVMMSAMVRAATMAMAVIVIVIVMRQHGKTHAHMARTHAFMHVDTHIRKGVNGQHQYGCDFYEQ